jgi:transcriptional regulator with XRE-family HTH domain
MDSPAKAIERLRLRHGLTRAEACRRAGLAPATWSSVESGSAANPKPRTKLRIARTLGVRPSSIWRIRPRPLHLDDVEDPRWRGAVRAMAQRLDRHGSLEERQHFGRRLIEVLDHADSGSEETDTDGGRWDEFWRLANSLTFDPDRAPITIINGKLVERDLDTFTPATRVRVAAARSRRPNPSGVAPGPAAGASRAA